MYVSAHVSIDVPSEKRERTAHHTAK